MDWIKIDPCWFTATLTGTQIVSIFAPPPSFSGLPTWTDEEISYVVNEAHRLGISVVGSLQFWALDNMTFCGWCRQSEFRPRSWDDWMSSYQSVVSHLAELYSGLGVDMFCPGVELYNLAGEVKNIWAGKPVSRYISTEDWNRSMVGLVEAIRAMFKGPVTWATAPLPLNLGDDKAYERVAELFHSLDVIGLNAYFHPFSNRRNPTLAEVLSRFEYVKTHIVDPIANEFDKPIIFTESGVSSTPYSLRETQPVYQGVVDLDAQLLYYKGLVRTFGDDRRIFGKFWWSYALTASAGSGWGSGGVWDWGFSPRLKPAQDYLRTVYLGTSAVQEPVKLDGEGDEWTPDELLATDPRGDEVSGAPDIISLHALIDGQYLYIHVGFADETDSSSLPQATFFLDIDGDEIADYRILFSESYERFMAVLHRGRSDNTPYGYADAVLGKTDLEIRLALEYMDSPIMDLHVSFGYYCIDGARVVWLDRVGDAESAVDPVAGMFTNAGDYTTLAGEVINGTRSICGHYEGNESYMPYLRTDPSTLPLIEGDTYQVTFDYRILESNPKGFETLFYSPKGGSEGKWLRSKTVYGAAGTTGTATLTAKLFDYLDYEVRWNIVATGAIAIDDIILTDVSTGEVVLSVDAE